MTTPAQRLSEILKTFGSVSSLQRVLHVRAQLVVNWRNAKSFPQRKHMLRLMWLFMDRAAEIELLFAAHYARRTKRSRHVRAEHPAHGREYHPVLC